MIYTPLKRVRYDGFTLIEVILTIGILSVVLLVSAQGLAGMYYLSNLQAQRYEAVQHCQTTLNLIRQDRRTLDDTAFPDNLMALWPEDENILSHVISQEEALNGETITVSFVEDISRPLEITVAATWIDTRNRTMSLELTTLMSSQ